MPRKCNHPDCKTHPTYNNPGETKALYCAEHRKPGMVDVKHKTCNHPDCKKHPTYNNLGETKALYCAEHRKSGMVDVTHKICNHSDCKTRPTYNNPGETKALYCVEHRKPGMVDVKHKTCKIHMCDIRAIDKYDGYCFRCYMYMFPDKPVSRNYKTKEYSVVEHIKSVYPELSWVSDKTVSDGCSKRRPDLLLDLAYQIIIVEIDENQHIDYDCSCENKRIMELSQDLGHRPIIFIRFNPDEYDDNGHNISSCWGIDKKGLCVIKKSKMVEWNKRLNALEGQINYWINPSNKTDKTVEIIQLFYDK
jgi:hypothetical protein